MELLWIHPPQANWKKSSQGSAVWSIVSRTCPAAKKGEIHSSHRPAFPLSIIPITGNDALRGSADLASLDSGFPHALLEGILEGHGLGSRVRLCVGQSGRRSREGEDATTGNADDGANADDGEEGLLKACAGTPEPTSELKKRRGGFVLQSI